MKIKTSDFRQMKSVPYALDNNRRLKVAAHAHAQIGERFFQYEDADGNILFVRESNIDAQSNRK